MDIPSESVAQRCCRENPFLAYSTRSANHGNESILFKNFILEFLQRSSEELLAILAVQHEDLYETGSRGYVYQLGLRVAASFGLKDTVSLMLLEKLRSSK